MENINSRKFSNSQLVQELIEDRKEDEGIVKSFKEKDSLSPDIFSNDGGSFIMLPDIRKQLIKIGDNFIDTLSVEFFIHDIVLTGSLCNYNWSEYSDVDLHIILDMDEFGAENKNEILARTIFKEFFELKKEIWNAKHDIRIKNFDVELYVQDINEKHISSGVFSILHNKWLLTPKREDVNIDERKILDKAEFFAKKIDSINDEKDSNVIEKIDDIKNKLKRFRQCGLEKGGEHSYENLTFKLLRRNGYIGKLMKLKNDIIDNKLSVK